MGVTRDLTSFAAELAFEDPPEDVVEVAKLSTLNILATCLGGYRTRIGRLHVELARELGGGSPQATIVGDGSLVSVPAAAYANANLGFALDYEDMLYQVVHAGYATVAAALAVGEYVGARGRDCLAAIVAGYEVSGRIGVAVQPTPERGSEVWGEMFPSFAAAVTAGRLLELDADEMDVALGIAGTYAPLPSTHKYFGIVEETRPMREVKQGWGWMCMGGRACRDVGEARLPGRTRLSRRAPRILDHGRLRPLRLRAHGGGARPGVGEPRHRVQAPSIDRDEPPGLLGNEAARRGAPHTRRGRRAGEGDDTLGRPDRRHRAHERGRRSVLLPYTIAATILGLPLGPELYAEETMADPALRRLLRCTEVVHDPDADRAFFEEQHVVQSPELQLANGRRLSRDIEFPRDAPPYGRPEIERKFEHLATGVLDAQRQAEVRTAIDGLERLGDVAELTAVFR